jgi:hypothetical protein
MTEVYWNSSLTEIKNGDAGYNENIWYDYIAQSSDTTAGGTSKWANTKLSDGSYFVWIPRYAYKITYYTDATKTTISQTKTYYGNIDVLFMYGTSSTQYIDSATSTPLDLPSGYRVHPAFINNVAVGGWDSELKGIWISKYEASRSDATFSAAGISNTLKFAPSIRSLSSITIYDAYTKGINYDTTRNSHMLKHTEWGAVIYLTASEYGRNASRVTKNNNANRITGYAGVDIDSNASTSKTYAYNTSQGLLAASTGNIYGVYDLIGGVSEFVASSYLQTANPQYATNGSSFAVLEDGVTLNPTPNKYYTPYGGGELKYGDAMGETQWWEIAGSGGFTPGFTFFKHGSPCNGDSSLYFYYGAIGEADQYVGFRVCLITN